MRINYQDFKEFLRYFLINRNAYFVSDGMTRKFWSIKYFQRRTCMIKRLNDPNFRILTNDENIVIGHEWELTYLINLTEETEVYLGDFYGDPTCALISRNKEWCIVGGDHLVVWHQSQGIIALDDKEFSFVVSLNQSGTDTVELLIDGGNENHLSLWVLCISDSKFIKVADIARN